MQEYLPIHICLLLAANRILISKASFLLFRLRVEVGVNCCGADSFQSCRGKDFSAYILTALTAFHSYCIICFQVSSLSLSNKISVSKDLAGLEVGLELIPMMREDLLHCLNNQKFYKFTAQQIFTKLPLIGVVDMYVCLRFFIYKVTDLLLGRMLFLFHRFLRLPFKERSTTCAIVW